MGCIVKIDKNNLELDSLEYGVLKLIYSESSKDGTISTKLNGGKYRLIDYTDEEILDMKNVLSVAGDYLKNSSVNMNLAVEDKSLLAKEYHESREAFAVVNNEIIYLEDKWMSHHDWLVKGGLLTEEEFESTLRGFIKDNKAYFYVGKDFSECTDTSKLKYYSEMIEEHLYSGLNAVYTGMEVGRIGEEWKPSYSFNRDLMEIERL